MARSVAVSTLLSDLANECDENPFDTNTYVTKTQAIRYLSQSVHAFSLQYRGFGLLDKTATIAVVAGTVSYSLPSDFAALKFLTFPYNNRQRPIARASYEDIILATPVSGAIGWSAGDALYTLDGEKLVFNEPGAAFTVNVFYVPELPMLNVGGTAIADFSADTDQILCKTAIDQWVVFDSAIKVKRKQMEDPSLFIAARQDIESALQESVIERDAMHAPVVSNAWDRTRGANVDHGGERW